MKQIPSWNRYTSEAYQLTPEEEREQKKIQLISILDGDDYLLQEVIIELRQKKMSRILIKKKKIQERNENNTNDNK